MARRVFRYIAGDSPVYHGAFPCMVRGFLRYIAENPPVMCADASSPTGGLYANCGKMEGSTGKISPDSGILFLIVFEMFRYCFYFNKNAYL
jgi:hypothetical protein